jgi:hypothetical protein
MTGFTNTVNEPSGSIKAGELFDQLNYCQMLEKDSASWSQLLSCWKITEITCKAFE